MTFFASMSHELRNPLNALLGCIHLLESSENSYAYDEEALTTANICGETLLNLIGNVMDMGKIEANKLELAPQITSFPDIIQKLSKMTSSSAKPKGLFLKTLIDPTIPEFLTLDSHKLSQIMINILGNAVKFTNQGGIFIKANWIPFIEDIQIPHLRKQIILKSDRKRYVENMEGFPFTFILNSYLEMTDEEKKDFGPKLIHKYSNKKYFSPTTSLF